MEAKILLLALLAKGISAGYSDPSQAPAICATAGSDSILIAHEDCDKFYKCYQGKPVAIDCPLNLVYNPDKEYCDWPENVVCQKRKMESDDVEKDTNHNAGNSDPSQAPAICAGEGSNGKLVAHEDCSKFYKCYQGEPVAIDCPLNLVYNPDKEYCDWPENVVCQEREVISDDVEKDTNNNAGNSDPSQAPAICAEEGSNGKLVTHEDCSKFYKCYQGEPVAIDCPLNLVYNPDKEYCDWPENVVCQVREVISDDVEKDTNNNAGNSDPSQAPAICAEEGSNVKLVAHEDCSKFYKCYQGKPVALDCPLNLVYNPDKEYCDWPENVVCRAREVEADDTQKDINAGDNDLIQATANCAKEGSDSKLVAHKDCSKFYICSEGIPVELSCPLNLLYNPEKEYCDWPENVDCLRAS